MVERFDLVFTRRRFGRGRLLLGETLLFNPGLLALFLLEFLSPEPVPLQPLALELRQFASLLPKLLLLEPLVFQLFTGQSFLRALLLLALLLLAFRLLLSVSLRSL